VRLSAGVAPRPGDDVLTFAERLGRFTTEALRHSGTERALGASQAPHSFVIPGAAAPGRALGQSPGIHVFFLRWPKRPSPGMTTERAEAASLRTHPG